MATKAEYAEYIMQLMDGDTYMIGDMMKALQDDGFVDENLEWIGEDDEVETD